MAVRYVLARHKYWLHRAKRDLGCCGWVWWERLKSEISLRWPEKLDSLIFYCSSFFFSSDFCYYGVTELFTNTVFFVHLFFLSLKALEGHIHFCSLLYEQLDNNISNINKPPESWLDPTSKIMQAIRLSTYLK